MTNQPECPISEIKERIFSPRNINSLGEKELQKCRKMLENKYVVIGIDDRGDLFYLGKIYLNKKEAISYSRAWAKVAAYMPYIAVIRCTDIVRED
mgnify:CR=1 FL=1